MYLWMLAALDWFGFGFSLLLMIRKRLRELGELIPSLGKPEPILPSLTVITPMRNEAANIGRCLDSLLVQTYPSE